MRKNATDEEDDEEDEGGGRTHADLLHDVAEVGAQDDVDVGQGLVDVRKLGKTRRRSFLLTASVKSPTLRSVFTREKSALVPSWASVARTEVQVCDTAPLVQAGSDRVLDSEARSSDRLALSLPVPS